MYSASTQNSAGGAPVSERARLRVHVPEPGVRSTTFFYHPDSNKIFREPLERMHGIKFLFTHCELRGIMLGNTWRDKPTVTSITEIAGTRNRVTGTQLGRIADGADGASTRPPIAWEETLDGPCARASSTARKPGPRAVALYANMAPVRVAVHRPAVSFCGTRKGTRR